MYFNANPATFQKARHLRNNMTFHEKILWERLKGKKICGLRFRRQHPVDFFIADFYCHEARLVIEIDGEIHNKQKDYDQGRSAEMEKYGILVLRFSNFDIEEKIEEVIKEIEKTAMNRIELLKTSRH